MEDDDVSAQKIVAQQLENKQSSEREGSGGVDKLAPRILKANCPNHQTFRLASNIKCKDGTLSYPLKTVITSSTIT